MCYFVEINLPRKQLEQRFDVPMPHDPRYMPGYFINAFSRPYLPVITNHDPDKIQPFTWGLIPFWVKDAKTAEKIGNSTYNARAETIWEKPSFRDPARHKRCLVLAHGFYEYYTAPGRKIPFYIRRKDNQPFAFAGLFDKWTNPDTGEVISAVSIITTQANALLEKIHNSKKRMPVILSEVTEKEWINDNLSSYGLKEMLRPSDPGELEAWSVSKQIRSPQDSPDDKSVLTPEEYPETANLLKQ